METTARVLLSPVPTRSATTISTQFSNLRCLPRFFGGATEAYPKLTLPGRQRLVASKVKYQPIRVKSSDTEGSPNPNPSLEVALVDELSLQQDLEAAIREEDYARAAKIRDQLRLLQEDSQASVLAANARFYNAFKNGDLTAMHSIWAKGDHVYVVHPSAGRIDGYEMVMSSWEIVCGPDFEFPLQIDLKNVEVHVRGNLGYVTCMEVVKTKGSWGRQVATNVFEKIDGQWYICIHHASHIDDK
ncbi:hypothetical protein LUZ61_002792 [Rhynchospora tenuis]|uniref:SnoaL-like domain-containing protein n=1 Tax=Rhynchospora tenuis TaxID=198213 RepID=A0AAD6ES22_9POAL|nr:hypothetical protein LUZ61_002792 [Rhynchospora tenuis]